MQTGVNRAPTAAGIVQHQRLEMGEPAVINIGRYFWDPDGDPLTYTIDNPRPDVIEAVVTGQTLTLIAQRPKSGSLSVTASDPEGETASHTIGYEAHPDLSTVVWSKNGYDGESYEFKTNCRTWDRYTAHQDCFLWNLTAVRVTTPRGEAHDLRKDFNIQEYSGEVTQRWVLYGPAGAGFPVSGDYKYQYYIGNELEYEQTIPYTLSYIDPPTNVRAQRDGNDLVVDWEPPRNPTGTVQYKVIVWNEGDNYGTISQALPFGARSARLPDIPVHDGAQIQMHVMAGFWYENDPYSGGYSYSEYVRMTW